MGEMSSAPTFFATAADWRTWLAANHATAPEISVGFWKVGSGRPSMTWPESVDEALCFGWIDGVRHRIDDTAYRIRFTPRRPGSDWSRVNVKRFGELKAEGRIAPAGQAAFEVGGRSSYSFERDALELTPQETQAFQANAAAWANFQAFPPGYRKLSIYRVASAKRSETRARRLAVLIDACEDGRRLDALTPAPKPRER